MTLLATSGLVAFLPYLIFLACPLMMVFMMRGMGHGSGGHDQGIAKPPREQMSLDELKRERDELNGLIGDRAERIVHSRASHRSSKGWS